jgi:hypothetical protein
VVYKVVYESTSGYSTSRYKTLRYLITLLLESATPRRGPGFPSDFGRFPSLVSHRLIHDPTIIIIHLLGRTPTGDLDCTLRTARGPEPGWCLSRSPLKMQGNTASVGRLNPLNRRTIRKPPRRRKITTQVLGGLPCATHVSVCPEPPPGRKPPALLASLERVAIGQVASESAGRATGMASAAFLPTPFFVRAGAFPFVRTGIVSRGTLTFPTSGVLPVGVDGR